MTTKEFKILEFLYDTNHMSAKNVAPLLNILYKVDTSDSAAVLKEAYLIKFLIQRMKTEGLIEHWGLVANQEEQIQINIGKKWLGSAVWQMYILDPGRAAYEEEKHIRLEESLRASQIKTNKSVNKLNKITRRNQDISILLTIISTAFIILTGVKACDDNTEKKVEAITTQMKEQTRTFDSISSSLEKLYKVVEANKPDTGR